MGDVQPTATTTKTIWFCFLVMSEYFKFFGLTKKAFGIHDGVYVYFVLGFLSKSKEKKRTKTTIRLLLPQQLLTTIYYYN